MVGKESNLMRFWLFLVMAALLVTALQIYGRGRRSLSIPGLEEHFLYHDGLERSYWVYKPPQEKASYPLVLVLHGGGGNARGIARTTKMHRIAEQEGFIVVYPNGTGRGKHLTWNAGMEPPQGYAEKHHVDDVGFIRRVIDELSETFPIDERRIYATGLSKGGMFAYRLACEMSQRIAAIAPVAATMVGRCRPKEAVSILHIHGTRDEHVPFEGGKGAYTARRAMYPSVLKGLEVWRRIGGCSAAKTKHRLSQDTLCWSYVGCRTGIEIRYCLVEGGGHAWPGAEAKRWQKRRGVHVTKSFSASRVIWRFFQNHPKSETDSAPEEDWPDVP